jgi:hypothetical protein
VSARHSNVLGIRDDAPSELSVAPKPGTRTTGPPSPLGSEPNVGERTASRRRSRPSKSSLERWASVGGANTWPAVPTSAHNTVMRRGTSLGWSAWARNTRWVSRTTDDDVSLRTDRRRRAPDAAPSAVPMLLTMVLGDSGPVEARHRSEHGPGRLRQTPTCLPTTHRPREPRQVHDQRMTAATQIVRAQTFRDAIRTARIRYRDCTRHRTTTPARRATQPTIDARPSYSSSASDR